MRILVCGGRDYADVLNLKIVLNEITHPGDTIISGAARGADQMAVEYAVLNGLAIQEYPADWKLYGKKAGPIRNQQMLDEGKPDLVVAFPGGIGTADMVRRATKAGVEVIKV